MNTSIFWYCWDMLWKTKRLLFLELYFQLLGWLITFISLFYKRWNFSNNISTFILPKFRLVRPYKNHSKQVQILPPKTLTFGFQVHQTNLKMLSYFLFWEKIASNCQNTTNKNCVTKTGDDAPSLLSLFPSNTFNYLRTGIIKLHKVAADND